MIEEGVAQPDRGAAAGAGKGSGQHEATTVGTAAEGAAAAVAADVQSATAAAQQAEAMEPQLRATVHAKEQFAAIFDEISCRLTACGKR